MFSPTKGTPKVSFHSQSGVVRNAIEWQFMKMTDESKFTLSEYPRG